GQHYDDRLSDVFFADLAIPQPAVHLGIGSGSHGVQTGAMLSALDGVLDAQRPDWVLVYGDTNSTLAGALAAAKLRVPVAHVEAGLRSFNRAMPEELNRVVADHLSSVLLCPSPAAVENLKAEGVTAGVHLVGDVMYDAVLRFAARAEERSTVLRDLGLGPNGYLLATVHRAENTDDTARLREILSAFSRIGEPVVFPVHPRTRKIIGGLDLPLGPNVRAVGAVGYLDMLALERHARMILTDSGGVQKEAYWLGVPCVTLRDETEWVETVEAGWNTLAGADRARILEAVKSFRPAAGPRPRLYGDGRVAERCVRVLESRA
ncbi:MAG: UDP-N-acetylglucosamine 2-epimerase (non-hydrolyzing), partial [Acidobacteriota bacterium]|nr:UDP-N-acetylglucosamine 2-epimerase (non-hydrolyzing) [Acidobacteriota bacterium]